MASETGALGDPPYPLPGFEADLIRQVGFLVAALPPNTARMTVSRVPGHPEWAEPYFVVTPTSPKAARFRGVAVMEDLNLTIGDVSWREFPGFAQGGTLVRGATWQEELSWIWQAVTEGGFTEHVYRDSKGKAIGWATKLIVNGKDLVIRNGRKSERPFGRTNVGRITYEPYIR